MAGLFRYCRSFGVEVNRVVGRAFGFSLARSPLPGSLAVELRRMLSGLGIDNVVDVGAHHGGFALSLRRDVRYQGSITSFEPSPGSYRRLCEVASNDPEWNVMNVALGAKKAVAEFNEFSGDGQFDSLRLLGQHASVYAPGLVLRDRIAVSVERLDSVWPGLGARAARTLLKTDTQGFDLEVLAGAGDLLREIPAVLMEVAVKPIYCGAPVVADVLSAMARYGFEITGAFPVQRYAGGLRVLEFDCTFVNARLFGDRGDPCNSAAESR